MPTIDEIVTILNNSKKVTELPSSTLLLDSNLLTYWNIGTSRLESISLDNFKTQFSKSVQSFGFNDLNSTQKQSLVDSDTSKKWLVFDSLNQSFEYWNGTVWESIGSGSQGAIDGGRADSIYTNSQIINGGNA